MVHNDLEDNDIKIYSADNEEKLVVAETAIRTLKNKIYEYMTWIFRNVSIANLHDIHSKYNNTLRSTIKLNPFYVRTSTCIDFHWKNNKEDYEYTAGDHI